MDAKSLLDLSKRAAEVAALAKGNDKLITDAANSTPNVRRGLEVGRAEYDKALNDRIDSAKSVIAKLGSKTIELQKAATNDFPFYAVALPTYKAIKAAYRVLDPEFVRTVQKDFGIAWKRNVFYAGGQVKEGKRLYPLSMFASDASESVKQYITHNKDAFKAKLLFDAHNPALLPLDIRRSYQYLSSKGFHKYLLGRSQKDRKQFKKRHLKLAKREKMHKQA